MDTFSCHGGLVLDEIKLSEDLNVKSSGDIEGFVDLGDHTTDQKGVFADQGMVVMLQPFTDASDASSTSLLDALDGLFEQGKVDDVDEAIQAVSEGDHEGYNEKRSNSALLYYVSGYVARKIIAKTATERGDRGRRPCRLLWRLLAAGATNAISALPAAEATEAAGMIADVGGHVGG
ncbi:hypothetical protein HPB52_025453 [Rhipicephalus sanguineus]|uniref:Transposable element P transposase-like RNase H domain-containing protein n=1 Tax=Rhipicephalus sanguineus TaxID=34632 RepID=A0A9D4TD35_RHISA|nr:hypothetical protein HPB52_025453 [Rhipicephalus sanguineus]